MYTVLTVEVRPNLPSDFVRQIFPSAVILAIFLPSAMVIFIGITMTVAMAKYIFFADAVAIVIFHT